MERDPDALRLDDRRYFSVPVQTPPRVRLTAGAPEFLVEALSVLRESGRATDAPGSADVILSMAGDGLGSGAVAPAWVVFPPTDADVLPALNRRLSAAGVPWQYRPVIDEGERRVETSTVPRMADEVRVFRRYALEPTAGPGPPPVGSTVVASLGGGDPWFVAVRTDRGRVLLSGSPLDPTWSTLPISASMVPVLEWMVATWASQSTGGTRLEVGDVWQAPDTVSAVSDPDGVLVPLEGDRRFRARRAGLYRLMAGSDAYGTVAVNPPSVESDLARAEEEALQSRTDLAAEVVPAGRWSGEVFRSRQGPEIWRPLLIALIAVLVLESWIAASGSTEEQPAPGPTPRPA